MNKTTRIAGIDNKYGRKSRTGSTISMNISDIEAMECQQYLMSIEAGEEPSGRIKKIELVMYSEDDLKEVVELPSTKELDIAIERANEVHNGECGSGSSFNDFLEEEGIKIPTHEGNQRDLDIYEDVETK